MTKTEQKIQRMISELDQKYNEIQQIISELKVLTDKEQLKGKTHAKTLIKQGMNAFFEGNKKCPYEKGSEESEYWSYGFNISKDSWQEIKEK